MFFLYFVFPCKKEKSKSTSGLAGGELLSKINLDLTVTNYYFESKTSHNELLLASSQIISPLISRSDSSYSWVLVRALGIW